MTRKARGSVVKAAWLLLLGTSTAGAVVHAQSPAQQTLTLRSQIFANTRTLRVLLPPGYNTPANSARRYPVFYFTDGVAAWDAWGVPGVVQALWSKEAIPPFIVVGIDNGGSTRESRAPIRDRASEYLPYPDPFWTDSPPVPRGALFPRFLFEEVVPLIDSSFRTISSGRCTGLAGASYGGAITLYTAMQFPDRLGFALIESPSLHIGDGRMLKDAAAAGQWPARMYIGVGTAEGETQAARDGMARDARTLRASLEGSSKRPVVLYAEKEGATHWYDAWKERLPAALTGLLAGDALARCA